MRRVRRALAPVLRVATGLLIVALAGVWVMTQTDFGRDKLRIYGVRQLAERVHGKVSIREVRGDLLSGVRLVDVLITDSAGGAFLSADTISLRYAAGALFRKHLVFSDVRLVHPVVVFDQPPGQPWNVERLFQGDTTVARGDTIPGFGDWVRLDDVTMVDGDVLVRRAWSPPDSLRDEARARAIEVALSPDGREMILPAPGGYQSISSFQDVNGHFPLIRFADPDSASRVIDVDSLRMTALPFKSPGAEIRNLSGRLVVTEDTIGFDGVRVSLPASELRVDGAYAFSGDIGGGIRIRGEPLSLADLRFMRPSLPDGGGSADLTISQTEGETRLVAKDLDLEVEGATLEGFTDVESRKEGVRFRASDLTFEELDTRTIERLVPGLDVPIDGVLRGRLALAGTTAELGVDGFTEVRERNGAISRIHAEGTVIDGPGGAAARDLRLRFDPLRMGLVERLGLQAPVGGAITGTATVSGALASVLDLDADLVHEEPSIGRSHVLARGGLRVKGGLVARRLALRLEPLRSRLVRVFDPTFPLAGTLTGRMTLNGPLDARYSVDGDLVHEQVGIGRSHVVMVGDVRTRGGLFASGLRLRSDQLQAGAIRAFGDLPGLAGTFAGVAEVSGPLDATFTVDADVTHTGEGGASHVRARGGLKLKRGFGARGLSLRLDPLQAPLFRVVWPGFLPGGSIAGSVTLNGAPTTGIAAAMEVTHRDVTGSSVIAGDVTGKFGAAGLLSFDVNVNARPLALATLGRFFPAAGLRGSVTGPILARGTPSSATVRIGVDVAGGGRIDGAGTLGAGPTAAYDFRADVAAFDAGAVTSRAPHTTLNGVVSARGVGTDPRTANAVIDAALADSRLGDTPRLDSTRVIARLADGLVTLERGLIRLSSARADLEGSFGLVAGRSGELRYSVTADSLAQFQGFAPPSSTAVETRPLVRARDVGQVRADSARAADQATVETLATGRPAQPVAVAAAPAPLRRDSISGAISAEGVLVGNVTSFDARGTARLQNVVYNGSSIARGAVAYTATRAGSPHASLDLEADLGGVRTAGFAFDSATATVHHAGGASVGTGRAELSLVQDVGRDYQLSADYRLALDRQELVLNDVAMRFDSTRWTSRGPGTIRWAGEALELEHIDLASDRGGRIFADGRLPAHVSGTGTADLRVSVAALQIADVAALLQDTLDTRGLLTLDATFRGTTRAPLLSGTMALDSAARAGRPLPSVRATFDYAGNDLAARLDLLDGARALLTAEAHLPADLAFVDRTGPLLPIGPVSIDLEADSFPLESLPFAIPQVESLTGRVRGTLAVRGTSDAPTLSGSLALLDASAHMPANGVDLRAGTGALRFAGDRVLVDSLVATSGTGTLHVNGSIGLQNGLLAPALDLTLQADDALLLADERGNVTGTTTLYVVGPLDQLSVTGEIHVAQGVIDVPEPQNMQRATRLDDPQLSGVYESLGIPDALRPRSPLLENTTLDVWVWVARDTWLRNTVMNVEVYTPSDFDALHVTLDPATLAFVLEGVINADRGDYTFAGREFKLTTGSVTFLPEQKDPLLQLSARHEVPRRGREALTILIGIGGTLSAPKLALSSNVEPPIAESDLLSYLAFGRESSSLLTGEGSGVIGDALGGLGVLAEQQLAGLGLGALTQALFSNIESQGMKMGLDVFRVRPRALPDELNFSGYFQNLVRSVDVQAGEYLRKDLFVAVEGQLGGGVVPGLRAEYFTQRGFSWVTTWEPRFLTTQPSLEETIAQRTRVFGSLIQWLRRF